MSEPLSTRSLCWDLHCHSSYSDGILSPQALVERASNQGVTTLALTDHDTTAGLPELLSAALDCNLDIVTGVELSTQWAGSSIHVVALNFPLDCETIQRLTIAAEHGRILRAQELAERLEKCLKIPDSHSGQLLSQAQQLANGAVIGRPHFAQVLCERGYVANTAQAFKKFLGAGKVGDVKSQWPELVEVVEKVRQSGSVPVLAHPGAYKMTRTKLRRLIETFQSAGGLAVELSTPAHTPDFSLWLTGYLNERGLAASIGSDFHGPSAWSELGASKPLPLKVVQPVWSLF
jgi:predicted metal-dependent phosphoesterase TrpH